MCSDNGGSRPWEGAAADLEGEGAEVRAMLLLVSLYLCGPFSHCPPYHVCCSDYTVVAADNLGRVSWWDGRRGIQLHRQAGHEADVVALDAIEDAGGAAEVITGGIDGRVCRWGRAKVQPGTTEGAAPAPWVLLSAHKAHTHDVLAVAAGWLPALRRGVSGIEANGVTVDALGLDINGKQHSVASGKYMVLSGGLDCRLVMTEGRRVGSQEPFKVGLSHCSCTVTQPGKSPATPCLCSLPRHPLSLCLGLCLWLRAPSTWSLVKAGSCRFGGCPLRRLGRRKQP